MYIKPRMSFLLRIRHCLPNALCRQPLYASIVEINASKSNVFSRNLAQAARKDEDEDIKVEIDQTEHRGPPSEKVFRLADEVASLTLVEAAELGHLLMKKIGIKEMPIVGFMTPGTANFAGMTAKASTVAKEEHKPEKTVFELKLVSYEAASKIKVVKEVRGFTDLGLKEAKDLVEKTPSIIKKGVSKEDGEQLIEKLKALGATVVME